MAATKSVRYNPATAMTKQLQPRYIWYVCSCEGRVMGRCRWTDSGWGMLSQSTLRTGFKLEDGAKGEENVGFWVLRVVPFEHG